jgi:hypothetical protein
MVMQFEQLINAYRLVPLLEVNTSSHVVLSLEAFPGSLYVSQPAHSPATGKCLNLEIGCMHISAQITAWQPGNSQ